VSTTSGLLLAKVVPFALDMPWIRLQVHRAVDVRSVVKQHPGY